MSLHDKVEESLKKLAETPAGKELAPLLRNIFEASGEQRKMYEDLAAEHKKVRMDRELEYNRRHAAEKFIEKSPSDHDINSEQKAAFEEWQFVKGAHEAWLRGEI